MASRWFAQKWDSPEPIAFRELVQRARAGDLTEDDWVRAEWETDWRPARTVVGLFYAVRREESAPAVALSTREAASPVSASVGDEIEIGELAAQAGLEDASSEDSWAAPAIAPPEPVVTVPRWKQRWQQVRAAPAEATLPVEKPVPGPETRLLIEAALMERETRLPRANRWAVWGLRWQQGRELLSSPVVLRMAVALLLAIAVCTLTTYWAQRDALRFPNAFGVHPYKVPLVGECSPLEFSILLADLAVLSLVAGYYGTKRFEVWSDSE